MIYMIIYDNIIFDGCSMDIYWTFDGYSMDIYNNDGKKECPAAPIEAMPSNPRLQALAGASTFHSSLALSNGG